jgi:hypothetical protein
MIIVDEIQLYWNLDSPSDFAWDFIDLDNLIGYFMHFYHFDWDLNNMTNFLILFSDAQRYFLADHIQVLKA